MPEQTYEIKRSAVLSKDGAYRYVLHREMHPMVGKGNVVWIMLNPSTADAEKDDPTIRRCMNFSVDWGYGSMTVVNLFPLRTPSPEKLIEVMTKAQGEPKDVLKTNMGYIESECAWNNPGLVVCAWGTNGKLLKRNRLVLKKLGELGVNLTALRLSEDRHPWHPLYLPKDLKPIMWNGL